MKSIIILGGDGYIGWPAAMFFSKKGYEVTIIDNYFRRNKCLEMNLNLLESVPSLVERAKIWENKTGNKINICILDLSIPENMRKLFTGKVEYLFGDPISPFPKTVVHLAEQPSAPYSNKNYINADFTIINNLRVTNNLMWAVKDYAPDTHIIKLGTMGEYGTPNIDIEEGWLDITHKGRSDKFLFPRQAGSIYHTSKIMDTDLLWYGVRTWELKVTDLMQGPVYGLETNESRIDERLRTIFNYDEIFGTVINRFIVQAIKGYPLTVYGSGGQTRGYINLMDSLQCIYISEKNPPKKGELNIYNQIFETYTVNQLATMTKSVGDSLGYNVKINNIDNPRKELEEHYYNPSYEKLKELGVKPHLLTEEIMSEIFEIVSKNKANVISDIIYKGIKWN